MLDTFIDSPYGNHHLYTNTVEPRRLSQTSCSFNFTVTFPTCTIGDIPLGVRYVGCWHSLYGGSSVRQLDVKSLCLQEYLFSSVHR